MMRKIELTGLQVCTIIAALDDVRSDYFEKATIADSKGHESRAKMHHETADRYETIILSLQAQMQGKAA
jgi:hypothetical protein